MITQSTVYFFSSRRRHTRFDCDWSSDVCSSDLLLVRVLLNGTGLKAGVNEKGIGGRSPRGCGARLGLAFRITTAMKHLLHSGAAILLASFISGCATHVAMIGPARPPISPAAVRIYENPPRHYQQIAIINSSAGTTWLFPDRGSTDEAIADLRREAGALGGNRSE